MKYEGVYMNKTINFYFTTFLKWIALIFMMITLFGAMTAKTFDVYTLNGEFLLFLGFVVAILIALWQFNKSWMYRVVAWSHRRIGWITFAMFVLVVAVQITVLLTIKADQMSDAWILQQGIKGNQGIIGGIDAYLSRYPNNQLLFFAEVLLSKLVKDYGFVLQIINLIAVDVAIILFGVLANLLSNSKRVGFLATIVGLYFLGIQPIFLLVYSDTLSLAPMLLANIFILLSTKNHRLKFQIIYGIAGGFFFALSVALRPSTAVFMIAMVLIGILNLKILKKIVPFLILFVITFGLVGFGFKTYERNQTSYTIDPTRAYPPSSWLLIGSSGDENDPDAWHGAFNLEDLKTTDDASKEPGTSEKLFKDYVARLKERGLYSAFKLYFVKYKDTTDTGVVGYHRDGLWLRGHFDKSGLSRFIQNIFNETGTNRPYFNFLIQLLYIPIVLLIIVGINRINSKSVKMSFLLLSFVGGATFLLLFESGGTKYLIQYLPYWSSLAAIGAQKWWQGSFYKRNQRS